jgi:hypothetical protein
MRFEDQVMVVYKRKLSATTIHALRRKGCIEEGIKNKVKR